jgi:hypothetical protein
LTGPPERRAFVAPPLHQHVEGVGGAGQVSHNDGTKFQDPVPHTFIRDLKSTLRQTILDVAVAQRKAEIQPNRVPDDLGQEAMSATGKMRHAQS